jgi:hypothetical protein
MLRTTTVVDMERRLRKQIATAIEDNDDLPSISPVLLSTLKKYPPSTMGGRGSSREHSSSGNSSGDVDTGGNGSESVDVDGIDDDHHHRINPPTPSYLATADAMLRMYSAAAVMPTHLHTPLLGIYLSIIHILYNTHPLFSPSPLITLIRSCVLLMHFPSLLSHFFFLFPPSLLYSLVISGYC